MWVRDTEDGTLGDAGHGDEHFLDGLWMDVLAAGLDHVVGAALDIDVAVLVKESDVAGVEPPVNQDPGRRFWVAQAAAGETWCAEP